jgi:hypothetical protein
MELRILELAIRILDPRKWRTRLAQVAGAFGAVLWVWYRAVDHADVDRAVRDARRAQRRERIRARNVALERAKLAQD